VKKFEILRYLKRFSMLIFLLTMAGAAMIYLYAQGKQQYTASVVLKYTNDGIKDGYAPDGSDLDVNEIYSSTVIAQAMDSLGASGRLTTVRSNCSVTPIISEEQEVILTTKATKNAKGGGTIRKRSDGRWEARYTLGIDPKTGKQIQKSVYGKTQKEVRQKLTAITAEIDDGTYMDIPRLKTADWLNTWVTEYIGNVKSSTRKSYQDHVRLNIIPYIGNVPLSKVTAAMIQQMYNELQTEKELSPE